MQKVYFDHAATSFPKPPEVVSAMVAYMNGSAAMWAAAATPPPTKPPGSGACRA